MKQMFDKVKVRMMWRKIVRSVKTGAPPGGWGPGGVPQGWWPWQGHGMTIVVHAGTWFLIVWASSQSCIWWNWGLRCRIVCAWWQWGWPVSWRRPWQRDPIHRLRIGPVGWRFRVPLGGFSAHMLSFFPSRVCGKWNWWRMSCWRGQRSWKLWHQRKCSSGCCPKNSGPWCQALPPLLCWRYGGESSLRSRAGE